MKNLYILGACGSIGTQTLDIVRQNPDLFCVKGMSVGRNLELAFQLIEEFQPEMICFREYDEQLLARYKNYQVFFGDEGLLEISGCKQKGILVNALVGSAGLKPTVVAIESGKDICLANKETLVMAGDLINHLVDQYQVRLYPIDSEHSAIWQCICGESKEQIRRIIITASGGSFRDLTREQLKNVTLQDALNHPNWSMGNKITIDSATMMNKGFEVIEAHYLFRIPYNRIETILHRQSIVHSLVEYEDLSVKAVLGTPDMRIPIMYALSYPKHLPYFGEALDLIKIKQLSFEELSWERYPCLAYAYEALEKGDLYPCVLNASNEAAVSLFLNGKISFLQIEEIIRAEMDKDYYLENITIDKILEVNNQVQERILVEHGGIK